MPNIVPLESTPLELSTEMRGTTRKCCTQAEHSDEKRYRIAMAAVVESKVLDALRVWKCASFFLYMHVGMCSETNLRLQHS